MPATNDLTETALSLAREAGFVRAGVAPAGEVSDAGRFDDWLDRGFHGTMDYMTRHAPLRRRPDALVPGARSVLCLAAAYAPASEEPAEQLVARYARGRDYHRVLKRRCHALMDRLRQLAGDFAGRAFVDTAPVLERSLAVRAGLGWIGRNRCLTVPGVGSYVFLCEIVSELPLRPSEPAAGGCDACGACVRACPTGALTGDGLDARRCISYLTVEHRGPIPAELRARMGRRLIGCDACQAACPHNRTGADHTDPALAPSGAPLRGATAEEILHWTAGDWDAATRGSAARRASHAMFLRNAAVVAANAENGVR